MITTANRFSVLQGHAPNPPDPPDSSIPPKPPAEVSNQPAPPPPSINHRRAATDSSPKRKSRSRSSASPETSQITQLQTRPATLFKVAGTIAGTPTVILIDSGASNNFIAAKFAASLPKPLPLVT